MIDLVFMVSVVSFMAFSIWRDNLKEKELKRLMDEIDATDASLERLRDEVEELKAKQNNIINE